MASRTSFQSTGNCPGAVRDSINDSYRTQQKSNTVLMHSSMETSALLQLSVSTLTAISGHPVSIQQIFWNFPA